MKSAQESAPDLGGLFDLLGGSGGGAGDLLGSVLGSASGSTSGGGGGLMAILKKVLGGR